MDFTEFCAAVLRFRVAAAGRTAHTFLLRRRRCNTKHDVACNAALDRSPGRKTALVLFVWLTFNTLDGVH